MKTLRVLLTQENSLWVAQCLDLDICAQGESLEDAKNNFFKEIIGHIVLANKYETKPFENLGEVPQYYEELYDTAYIEMEDKSPVDWKIFEDKSIEKSFQEHFTVLQLKVAA